MTLLTCEAPLGQVLEHHAIHQRDVTLGNIHVEHLQTGGHAERQDGSGGGRDGALDVNTQLGRRQDRVYDLRRGMHGSEGQL